MKFRCERDVLADAVGSAGRATSGRGGALPVLAGLRLRLEGDHLEVTGSDLDLTVTAEIEVAGGDDGVAVIPARLLSDIVRAEIIFWKIFYLCGNGSTAWTLDT